MKKQIVEELVRKYNGDKMVADRFVKQQHRLRVLVKKYGVEKTSVASGLSLQTLLVYVRSSKPVAISEKCVSQAEWVFENYPHEG